MKPRRESCKQLYSSFSSQATFAGSGVQRAPQKEQGGSRAGSEAILIRKDVRHPDKLSAYPQSKDY